jgi:hypothetical protein
VQVVRRYDPKLYEIQKTLGDSKDYGVWKSFIRPACFTGWFLWFWSLGTIFTAQYGYPPHFCYLTLLPVSLNILYLLNITIWDRIQVFHLLKSSSCFSSIDGGRRQTTDLLWVTDKQLIYCESLINNWSTVSHWQTTDLLWVTDKQLIYCESLTNNWSTVSHWQT